MIKNVIRIKVLILLFIISRFPGMETYFHPCMPEGEGQKDTKKNPFVCLKRFSCFDYGEGV